MNTFMMGNYVFPDSQHVEPEHLFGFSKQYLTQLPNLKKRIKESTGIITLPVKRLDSHSGEASTKLFTGMIKANEPNGFWFYTREPDAPEDEKDAEIFFRYDNILGNVPCLSDQTNPYGFAHTETVRDYLLWWRSLHSILTTLPASHYVELRYKYSVRNSLFRKGNYRIIAKLTRINGSNLEFWHFKTNAWISSEEHYANIIPHSEIDRCVAPDRYLSAVTIYKGNFYMNPYDEE